MRLSAEEARQRFAAARVARLATADAEGRPHLVPVVFAVRNGEIVTAVDHKPKSTARLRRLRNVADRAEVCLLADEYDEDWDRLWWVRADGRARIVRPTAASGPDPGLPDPALPDPALPDPALPDPPGPPDSSGLPGPPGPPRPAVRADHSAAVAALRAKYAQYRDRPPTGPVIAIAVHRWTGWQAAGEAEAAAEEDGDRGRA